MANQLARQRRHKDRVTTVQTRSLRSRRDRDWREARAALCLLELVSPSDCPVVYLMSRLVERGPREKPDTEFGYFMLCWLQEQLMDRFAELLSPMEIRRIVRSLNIRSTRIWHTAYEQGQHEGMLRTKCELVAKQRAKGMQHQQIADLLDIPVREIRRLAASHAH
jgi:hypothetical protein